MITERMNQSSYDLPYGTTDLDPNIESYNGEICRVRCYVGGCQEILRVPSKHHRGDVCHEHGIRCHHTATSATYAYIDARRNIIASPDIFQRRVIGNPFKFESHRLGLERSEDALTWNVFRSLHEAGQLRGWAQQITGDGIDVEPFLYLWGLCLADDEFKPWNLLLDARRRFESRLPVERPLTEPDIAIFLPGRYLILIEAKFMSPNTFYQSGARKNTGSLTLDELRQIYHFPDGQLLDNEEASHAPRIYQQLWRNTVFAEAMAQADHPRTQAFHVNLVRQQSDESSAVEFAKLLRPRFRERFQRRTWEELHAYAKQKKLARLCRYLETKTAGLKRAFAIPSGE